MCVGALQHDCAWFALSCGRVKPITWLPAESAPHEASQRKPFAVVFLSFLHLIYLAFDRSSAVSNACLSRVSANAKTSVALSLPVVIVYIWASDPWLFSVYGIVYVIFNANTSCSCVSIFGAQTTVVSDLSLSSLGLPVIYLMLPARSTGYR